MATHKRGRSCSRGSRGSVGSPPTSTCAWSPTSAAPSRPAWSSSTGSSSADERCDDWRSTWETTAFDFRPDVLVAMWGAWEVFDHRVDRRTLVARTPEFGAAYEQALADSIEMVAAVSPDTRHRLRCRAVHDREQPLPGRRREPPQRLRPDIQWVNEHTAAVVARYPGRAMLVDLGPLVCRGRRPARGGRRHGSATRRHPLLGPTIAAVAWRYIDERIRPWLAVPAVAHGGVTATLETGDLSRRGGKLTRNHAQRRTRDVLCAGRVSRSGGRARRRRPHHRLSRPAPLHPRRPRRPRRLRQGQDRLGQDPRVRPPPGRAGRSRVPEAAHRPRAGPHP